MHAVVSSTSVDSQPQIKKSTGMYWENLHISGPVQFRPMLSRVNCIFPVKENGFCFLCSSFLWVFIETHNHRMSELEQVHVTYSLIIKGGIYFTKGRVTPIGAHDEPWAKLASEARSPELVPIWIYRTGSHPVLRNPSQLYKESCEIL